MSGISLQLAGNPVAFRLMCALAKECLIVCSGVLYWQQYLCTNVSMWRPPVCWTKLYESVSVARRC